MWPENSNDDSRYVIVDSENLDDDSVERLTIKTIVDLKTGYTFMQTEKYVPATGYGVGLFRLWELMDYR